MRTIVGTLEQAVQHDLRAAGWVSVADDLRDGLPAETVMSRLRSIGEGDSDAAQIVGQLT